jgi:hypothetical protein
MDGIQQNSLLAQEPRKIGVAPMVTFLNPASTRGLGKINQATVLSVLGQKYWQALTIWLPPTLRSLSRLMAGMQHQSLQEVESASRGSAPKGTTSKLRFEMLLARSLETSVLFATGCKCLLGTTIWQPLILRLQEKQWVGIPKQ